MPDFNRQVEPGRIFADLENLSKGHSPNAPEPHVHTLVTGELPPPDVVAAAQRIFELRPLLRGEIFTSFVDTLDRLPETPNPDGY